MGSRGAISRSSSKSASQSPLIDTAADWLTPETPAVLLKMEQVEKLRKELLVRLKHSKNVIDNTFQDYVSILFIYIFDQSTPRITIEDAGGSTVRLHFLPIDRSLIKAKEVLLVRPQN